MRVLHLYNTANDAYNIALGQREIGVDVHIVVDESQSIFTLPWWEETRRETHDVYDPSVLLEAMWEIPDWIHVVSKGAGILERTSKLYDLMKGYDIIQGYGPAPIYLQFQKTPYVIYECGWMRKFPFVNDKQCKLGRRGYSKAKRIIMTNPDLYYTVDKLKYLPPTRFIPFSINVGKYRYDEPKDGESLTFFNPARQNWHIKGTHKLLKGFVKYLSKTKLEKLPTLLMIDWGIDADRSKGLISSFPKKYRKQFVFQKVLSKPNLIQTYHDVDVVCDQFILGSHGTATPEAMACGRPVIMFLDEYYNKMCYRGVPPVCNAYSSPEITARMLELEDIERRRKCSLLGREWVEKHHSPVKVAHEHQELYMEVLYD